jgi:hypothetical protein
VTAKRHKDRQGVDPILKSLINKGSTIEGCPNFSYREWFTHGGLLSTHLIDYAPANAYVLIRQMACTLLQPLRAAMGRPVQVTSGYRTPQINDAVGGGSHSQHLVCEAVDLVFRDEAGNIDMAAIAQAQTWLQEHCYHGVGLSLIHHHHMHLSLPDGYRQSLFQVKV